MTRIVLILAIISLLSSCTPQKRFARLINRHPELIKVDSIFIRDTLITKEIRYDTAINYKFDTVILEKENLKLKLIRIIDTLYINSEVVPDTIIIEKKVPVDVPAEPYELNFFQKYYWLIIVLLCILIIFLAFKSKKSVHIYRK